MNAYFRGKTKVNLNGSFVGYASGVSIDKNTGTKVVNILVDGKVIDKKNNIVISEEENYDKFFQKFSKAFNKE